MEFLGTVLRASATFRLIGLIVIALFAASANATDTTPPIAPSGLTATATSGTAITLNWSAATDNVAVTGYLIERCMSVGCSSFAQVATTTTALTYNNTGLTSATSYSYRVRAKDAAGNLGPYSNTASATTLDTTAPIKPTGLTSSVVSGSQVNLSWSATTDNVAVAGYRVERCTGASCSSFAEIATTASLGYSDTALTSATLYRYRIRASDAAGNLSSYSSIVNATTIDDVVPSQPTDLSATATSGTNVTLAWTASTDNVNVTGYLIERCSGVGCSAFSQIATTTTALTYNNTGLTQGTSYSYRVRAKDAALNYSDYSDVSTVSTPDTTPPVKPTGLTATATSTSQIAIAWNATTDNVGVTGYHVERCTGSGCTDFVEIFSTSGTTYADTNLDSSTKYIYRIRASDAADNYSTYSLTASATTKTIDNTPPSKPGSLVVTAISGTQINTSWNASTDNIGVVDYSLERCQGTNCSSFVQIAQLSSTSYADNSLNPSTSYTYRVRARDDASNYSQYSVPASATTQSTPADVTPPTIPTDVTAYATLASQVALSWTASSDAGGVASYLIERCMGLDCNNFVLIGTSKFTAFNDTGLSALTSYVYRIRAKDPANNLSDYSVPVSATTLQATSVLHTRTYSYDDAGRLTQVQNADGSIIDYQYDSNGNLTSINRH